MEIKHPAEILTGFAGSVLLLLVAFGIEISEDQILAIGATIAWLPAIITMTVQTFRSFRQKGEENGDH